MLFVGILGFAVASKGFQGQPPGWDGLCDLGLRDFLLLPKLPGHVGWGAGGGGQLGRGTRLDFAAPASSWASSQNMEPEYLGSMWSSASEDTPLLLSSCPCWPVPSEQKCLD